ncbi:helix-turn-helix domain-containing protein [Parabacteroides pacaensis]|uniref:helix-turn-helix domain-containing protein n=1 Tax=Parabacteroides pacaensis TaxID=2086575 RepID=UPI001F2CB671|nr:helix-turn-helix transcriptional regulator [Parabacteroides pacaensis]
MEVKTIIKQKGFSMESVAKKMGITRVTLAQNLSRNPTVGTLQRIADVIGCKVGDFFIDDINIDNSELTALIQHKGDFYKATTIEELEKVIEKIKTKG